MKTLISVFVLLLFATTSFAQNDSSKTILGRKLLWSDFTGDIDKTSEFAAMTYWSVNYSYNATWNSQSDTAYVTFTVLPYFKNKSWVKKNLQSDELLRHEQRHYDLAVICAEMIREKFVSFTFFRNDYTQKIDSIFQSELELVRQIELRYDAETNHMLNRDEQARWNQNITVLQTKFPAANLSR